MKTTQYSLLVALARTGPMRASDLARVLSLDASTLTRNLEPLVDAGWVESACGNDRRTRLLRLTRDGLEQRQRARGHWRAAQRDLERLLGPQTVAQLHALLEACHARLVADDEGDGPDTSNHRPSGPDETQTRPVR